MAFTENDIKEQYQSTLGRAPTAAEVSDFMRYNQNPYVDLGITDIQQILRGHPEAQESQLGRMGGLYSNALAQNDATVLGRAQEQLQGSFAAQGRQFTGSPYVAAFAQAAQNLAMQRQQTLANFYGQGYQNILGSTRGQAENAYGNAFGAYQGGRQTDRLHQYALSDYYTKSNDFQDALRGQSRRNFGQSVAGGIGGLLGGAAGFAVGGPALAGAGLAAGSKLGSGLAGGGSDSSLPQGNIMATGSGWSPFGQRSSGQNLGTATGTRGNSGSRAYGEPGYDYSLAQSRGR